MTRRFGIAFPIGFALFVGCNSAAVTTVKAVRQKAAPGEALADTVHEALQKSSDLAACRRLVEQLNVALARPDATLKPEPLSPQLQSTYAQEFGLTPGEIEEIARGEFTPLDGHVLEEAFLFHDLAKSLDVATLPPVERARAALDWVVRNVRGIEPSGGAVPPVFVVRRGTGAAIERMYVFLSLLRQLELDAALLGDTSAQPGDMWGVAVRTDDGLFVFDPRIGLPLPAPDGGVATLAQVRTEPAVFKPFAQDGKLPYDVTPERARSSQLFVAERLSALAPRLKFLQGLLPAGAARISGDVIALRDRFSAVAKGPGLADLVVRLWAAPAIDVWSRALVSFLPPNEGGTDRGASGQRRMDRYYMDQVPWTALPPFLLQLSGEPGDRIRASFATRILMLRQSGQARDLLIRGQFQDATEQLVAAQAQVNKRPIAETDLEENSRLWAETARGFYADLLRAERAAKTDPAAAASLVEIRERIDLLWKRSNGPSMYLDVIASPFLNDEITFLLASSKHEQAERQGHRLGAAKDPAIWETTRKWWIQYLNTYPNSPSASAARRNLAFALAAEGSLAAAKNELMALAAAPNFSPLEKLACLIRANQLK